MAGTTPKLNNLKVGLTVFIGLILFFVFIFIVGTENDFFSKNYDLKIFVDNSNGLGDGALVTLGGLKVGYVTGLQFARRNGINGVNITFSVKEKYKKQITNSSVATIKTIGLLGDKFIDISIGQPNEQPLSSNSFLPVEKTMSLDKLGSKIEPAIDDFTKLLYNLKGITDTISSGKGSLGRLVNSSKTIDKLQTVLDNLGKFTSTLSSGKGSLGKLASDTTLYDRINSLTLNLNDITSQIKNGKGSLGKFIMQDTVYNYASSISKRLDKLIAKAESDSTLAGGLFNDKKIYNQFTEIVNEVRVLLEEIKTDPQKYLRITVF